MNAYHKPLMSCFVFVSLFTLNGIVVADNADDIRLRVQKVGKLNIASQAAAEAPASPAMTGTPIEAPAPEVAVETPAAQTTVEAPAAESTPATTEPAATVASAASTGAAELYQTGCFACHGTGVLEAPKLGDKAAWAPRIAQGNDVLVEHAIKGFKAMPPRGASTLDDEQLKQLVAYMVESSQ